jgi:hypothetical protein
VSVGDLDNTLLTDGMSPYHHGPSLRYGERGHRSPLNFVVLVDIVSYLPYLQSFSSHYPCVWLLVFAGACIAGCNELVFGCYQPGSTCARCVFGYLCTDVESGSHDT